MQLVDDDDANPILIDKDRGEIMNCFIVIDISDQANSIIIHSFKSGKREILLRWPKEALNIIDRSFYCKDIQVIKVDIFSFSLQALIYFWSLLIYL